MVTAEKRVLQHDLQLSLYNYRPPYSYYFSKFYQLHSICVLWSRCGCVCWLWFSMRRAKRCLLRCLYEMQELDTVLIIDHNCVLCGSAENVGQPNSAEHPSSCLRLNRSQIFPHWHQVFIWDCYIKWQYLA